MIRFFLISFHRFDIVKVPEKTGEIEDYTMTKTTKTNATLDMKNAGFYAVYSQQFATITPTHDSAQDEKVLVNEWNIKDFDSQVDVAQFLKVDKSSVNHAINSGDFIYTAEFGAVRIYFIKD